MDLTGKGGCFRFSNHAWLGEAESVHGAQGRALTADSAPDACLVFRW
jgi:hypothetical protein